MFQSSGMCTGLVARQSSCPFTNITDMDSATQISNLEEQEEPNEEFGSFKTVCRRLGLVFTSSLWLKYADTEMKVYQECDLSLHPPDPCYFARIYYKLNDAVCIAGMYVCIATCGAWA